MLRWVPRILCILFAAFISLFAMDVFGQGAGFWKTFLALLIHLIPTFLMILILILSWRGVWIGAIFFILSGIGCVVWQGLKYPVLYIPLFLVGFLFLINWLFRKEAQKALEN